MNWFFGILGTIAGMLIIGYVAEKYIDGDGYGCNDGGDDDD